MANITELPSYKALMRGDKVCKITVPLRGWLGRPVVRALSVSISVSSDRPWTRYHNSESAVYCLDDLLHSGEGRLVESGLEVTSGVVEHYREQYRKEFRMLRILTFYLDSGRWRLFIAGPSEPEPADLIEF
jgi:hypothetical protein